MNKINPINIFLFFSVIIIISYFSNIIYARTKIPDLVWLLVFGVMVGPVFHIVNKDLYLEISPLISVATIILITFEAGTDIDFEALKTVLPSTIVLSLLTLFLITVGTGLILPRIFPIIGLTESLMVGTFLGGLSTVSVISIVDKLGLFIDDISNSKLILYLESTIVDPVRVMTAIVFIKILMESEVLPREIFRDLLFVFFTGSVIGLFTGIIWFLILTRLRRLPYNYMLTVAVLLQVYYLAEFISGEGGGTMACFSFGFTLANHKRIGSILGFNPRININRLVRINDEISFVLKSYYFVYIGVIASISSEFIMVGLVLTGMIIILRFISTEITGYITAMSKKDRRIISLIYPLGTSAFVFSQLPLLFDPNRTIIKNVELYSKIIFPVALGTIIFTAILVPYLLKRYNIFEKVD